MKFGSQLVIPNGFMGPLYVFSSVVVFVLVVGGGMCWAGEEPAIRGTSSRLARIVARIRDFEIFGKLILAENVCKEFATV